MYMCDRCGRLTEEPPTCYQTHGVTSLGDEYREKVDGGCKCGGEFVEAYRCKVCGDWFITEDGDEPYYKICDKCVEDEQTVTTAIEMGVEDERTVRINGFLVEAIGSEKINEILSAWAKENIKDDDVRVFHYCREDMLFFTEFVANKKGI